MADKNLISELDMDIVRRIKIPDVKFTTKTDMEAEGIRIRPFKDGYDLVYSQEHLVIVKDGKEVKNIDILDFIADYL